VIGRAKFNVFAVRAEELIADRICPRAGSSYMGRCGAGL